MIITVSGCDGSGKSTQIAMLMQNFCKTYNLKGTTVLEQNNNSHVYHSKEDVEVLYKKISKYDVIVSRFYLRQVHFQELQSKIRYAGKEVFQNSDLIKQVAELARKESEFWWTNVIKKLLKSDKIVIFDRYFYDEIAYRTLYGVPYEFMEELYKGTPKPDYAFYMNVSLQNILKRNQEREDQGTTLFQDEEKLKKLLSNFSSVSEKNEVSVIDADFEDVEKIQENIWEIITGGKHD